MFLYVDRRKVKFLVSYILSGLKYRLERQHEAGAMIDLESPLSAMTTLDFCLVRQNSKCPCMVDSRSDACVIFPCSHN